MASSNSLNTEFSKLLNDRTICQRDYHPFIHEDTTVGELLNRLLDNHEEKILQVCYDCHLNFSGLIIKQMSLRVARNLVTQSVEQTDVIGFICGNTKYLAPLVFGVILTGAQICALDPSFDKAQIVAMYRIAKPKYVFCDKVIYDKVMDAINELDFLVQVFLMNGELPGIPHGECMLRPQRKRDWEDFPVKLDKGSDHTLAIVFTAGSTGDPKPVRVSHRSMVHCIMDFQNEFIPRGIYTSLKNIYRITGLWSLLFCAVHGVKRVISNAPFHPKTFLSIIENYRVNFALTTPGQMAIIASNEAIKLHDIKSLRAWFVTGKTVLKSYASLMNHYLANAIVISHYGLTEVGSVICRETLRERRSGSVGKVMPHISIRIRDITTGEILTENKVGEILAYNRCKWMGYIDNPTENKNVCTDDGWIRTGDVGYYDNDGYIFISGRLKEIIRYKEFFFFPNEIEALIFQIPDVLDVIVCGIRDKKTNYDLPAAAVIKRRGSPLSQLDIRKYIEKNVVHFKHLSGGVYFLDKFPRSTSDKVYRLNIKKMITLLYKTKIMASCSS